MTCQILLDSIKNDDLWILKTNYQNTDTPWLCLVHECIKHDSSRCLVYLLEDMDFASLTDFVKAVNYAVEQGVCNLVKCIVFSVNGYNLQNYLEESSIEQQLAFFKSITHIHNIDWESLVDHGVINEEMLVAVLKESTFNPATLCDFISYLYYIDVHVQFEHDSFALAISRLLGLISSISPHDAVNFYERCIFPFESTENTKKFIFKCQPEALDIIMLEFELSEYLINNILSTSVNKLKGTSITKNIDAVSKLINKDMDFAKKILEHPEFEYSKDGDDEHQSWEWSLARELFNNEKFRAIFILIGLGAPVGVFIKLDIASGYCLAIGVHNLYCTNDDHNKFFNDIKKILDNGIVFPELIFSSINGDTAKFDFKRLYDLLSEYTTLNRQEVSEFVIKIYGSKITSYADISYKEAFRLYNNDNDLDTDNYHFYRWNEELFTYVGEDHLCQYS
uniref:Uncharacterized protein n=1 Tax=Aliivibrio wodanis TaxID=80852 RepID=A0A5Q4ZT13_9GAMM|nr:hypothetical protein AW0309160_03844 [Aliivibrio wodanis]